MFYRGKKCLFYHFFMECHSIQFTTISINVERGIVKILFKYRYFQDLLIDIDIFNFSISISISISIFSKITISISISIFLELPYRYRYRYFSELPYRYRYRYFQHLHIDIDIFQKCRYIDNRYVISNRATKRLSSQPKGDVTLCKCLF